MDLASSSLMKLSEKPLSTKVNAVIPPTWAWNRSVPGVGSPVDELRDSNTASPDPRPCPLPPSFLRDTPPPVVAVPARPPPCSPAAVLRSPAPAVANSTATPPSRHEGRPPASSAPPRPIAATESALQRSSQLGRPPPPPPQQSTLGHEPLV
ncbi:unnamed protein product [Linum trigynum]|uniref:Uncharacterized protein n=1 Tax=Linum trigynum TaxID=586398 RepID=A0AAV2GDR6_9ROSI